MLLSVADARSVKPAMGVAEKSPGAVTLDFVDVPIAEVARTLSLAYGTPILADNVGDVKVTFHLEGVSLFEGLSALCAANGLAVVEEGRVFHIRRARVQGDAYIALTDSGAVISVKNMNVRDFVKEFSLNTGGALKKENSKGTTNAKAASGESMAWVTKFANISLTSSVNSELLVAVHAMLLRIKK